MLRAAAGGEHRLAPARPTWLTAAPFVAVSALGVSTTFLPPYGASHGRPWGVLAAFLVVLGFLAMSLRRPVRTWVDPVAAFLFFPALAIARDLTGGSVSGLAPLVAVPILWLALTGTRRQVVAAGFCTAAVFVLPLLLTESDRYAASDWRRGVLWTAVALLVAPVIHRVVDQLARESQRARAAVAEMDGIMRAARLTSLVTTDPRGVVRSFNVGAQELLGHAPADVIGDREVVAFHDADEVAALAGELGVGPGFEVFAELARRRAPGRLWSYVRADG